MECKPLRRLPSRLDAKSTDYSNPQKARANTLEKLSSDFSLEYFLEDIFESHCKPVEKVLHQVIDEDQTGCVPKRFIGENIMLFLEAYEHMTASGGTGAFLFLDFEKAFDRVERTFIWSSMEHMDFARNLSLFARRSIPAVLAMSL